MIESAPPLTRLPTAATPLVGREHELAGLRSLLAWPDVRLVSVLGLGGVGKTRLALAVASELSGAFVGRVYFVPLASLRDPEFLISEVTRVLGLEGTGGALGLLAGFFSGGPALLVLDNLEHLLDAAAEFVADLLGAAPDLTILTTSRSPLRLSGEREFPLGPLALPGEGLGPEALGEVEAVRLFLDRARSVRPDFTLTQRNAGAVSRLVRRLDGLPLALELAAARLRLLSPEAMLPRLEHRLRLLTDGPRDLPVRQRTLRGTLDWSFDLLGEGERLVLVQLGCFVGGFSLEAAEAVVDPAEETDALEQLGSLVEKSLVSRVEGEVPRFFLLETVREYVLEKLEASGTATSVRERHLAYFLAFAEASVQGLRGPEQETWLEALDRERDNCRSALARAVEAGAAELALRFATALRWFWEFRGDLEEGRGALETALALSGDVAPELRARALNALGVFAWRQGALDTARTFVEEALSLRRAAGDWVGVGGSLRNLGVIARLQGNLVLSRTCHEEEIGIYRRLGDPLEVGYSLLNLGALAFAEGNLPAARSAFQEYLAVVTAAGDHHSLRAGLSNLGVVVRAEGDRVRARALHEEALAIARAHGHRQGIVNDLLSLAVLLLDDEDVEATEGYARQALTEARGIGDRLSAVQALNLLGDAARSRGDPATALAHRQEALVLARTCGDFENLVASLEGLAEAQLAAGQGAEAARLLGEAGARRHRTGQPATGPEAARLTGVLEGTRAQLDEAAFVAAWSDGWALGGGGTLGVPAPSPSQLPSSDRASGSRDILTDLTPRERDVLRLLSQGLTNLQISRSLDLSAHTVSGHIRSIFSKLDVTTRAAATRVALDRGLV
ncbi:tetratricopeptide repeat protein [Deinococcus apachensis]|uniref:tetratricopeptide repeat protein n=1 Tax=Deinococcus apachensis TaxID=309886 RepID=UPI00035C8A84|nr:tetratricopeptide repeat protein [Deinococcus apachensis]